MPFDYRLYQHLEPTIPTMMVLSSMKSIYCIATNVSSHNRNASILTTTLRDNKFIGISDISLNFLQCFHDILYSNDLYGAHSWRKDVNRFQYDTLRLFVDSVRSYFDPRNDAYHSYIWIFKHRDTCTRFKVSCIVHIIHKDNPSYLSMINSIYESTPNSFVVLRRSVFFESNLSLWCA